MTLIENPNSALKLETKEESKIVSENRRQLEIWQIAGDSKAETAAGEEEAAAVAKAEVVESEALLTK